MNYELRITRYIFLTFILISINLNAENTNPETLKTWIGGEVLSSLQQADELPLIIIPSTVENTGPVFFLISGDGGWTSFDNAFCELLAKKGIPVVGLDAKKYFWNVKSPEETSSVLVPVIEKYTKQWNRKAFILAGYSFGADLVPFIGNRLPEALKSSLSGLMLLSPDRFGDFEIHLTDMLSLGLAKRKYNIVEEVKKIKTPQVVCIFGQEEEAINIRSFKEAGSKISLLPGDHHYNKNVTALVDMILNEISGK
jgi:type IV secretory pathway VirJ component